MFRLFSRRKITVIATAFLAALLITFAQPATATAAGELRITNNNGVMYVTTDQDSTTTTTTAVTSTATPTPIPTDTDVVTENIHPGTGYASNIGVILNFILRLVMVIAVILVLFYLVAAGIQWIMSGGEKGKTEAARNKITAAIIGLVILAASYAILILLIRYLGFTDLPSVLNSVGTINNPGATPSPTATDSTQLRQLIP